MVVGKRLLNIAVYRHIPRSDVCAYALSLKAVASHQYATIILHHTLSVAIHIVQRQHDANAHSRTALLCHLRCRLLCRLHRLCGCRKWSRYNKLVALLQGIVGLLHIRIGRYQLVDGYVVFLGNAINGVLLLHLVKVLILHSLRRHSGGKHESAQAEKQSDVAFHYVHAFF